MMQNIWVSLLAVVLIVLAATLLGIYFLGKTQSSATYSAETLKEFSSSAVPTEAGFQITSLPADEILIPERYFLVNDTTVQIEYAVIPGWHVVLRLAPESKLPIPAEYQNEDYDSTSEYTIDGMAVTHKSSPGQKSLLTWSRDGFDYALYSEEPEMTLMGGISDDFIKNTKAEML